MHESVSQLSEAVDRTHAKDEAFRNRALAVAADVGIADEKILPIIEKAIELRRQYPHSDEMLLLRTAYFETQHQASEPYLAFALAYVEQQHRAIDSLPCPDKLRAEVATGNDTAVSIDANLKRHAARNAEKSRPNAEKQYQKAAWAQMRFKQCQAANPERKESDIKVELAKELGVVVRTIRQYQRERLPSVLKWPTESPFLTKRQRKATQQRK